MADIPTMIHTQDPLYVGCIQDKVYMFNDQFELRLISPAARTNISKE